MPIPNYPKSHPDVVLREEFEGQYLLFHLETGAMIGVNQVGAFIWQHLDGHAAHSDITGKMVSSFRVSPQTARRDMATFLEILAAQNLLVSADGGTL